MFNLKWNTHNDDTINEIDVKFKRKRRELMKESIKARRPNANIRTAGRRSGNNRLNTKLRVRKPSININIDAQKSEKDCQKNPTGPASTPLSTFNEDNIKLLLRHKKPSIANSSCLRCKKLSVVCTLVVYMVYTLKHWHVHKRDIISDGCSDMNKKRHSLTGRRIFLGRFCLHSDLLSWPSLDDTLDNIFSHNTFYSHHFACRILCFSNNHYFPTVFDKFVFLIKR